MIMFLLFSNIEKKIENALEGHVALVELADDIQFEMAMQGLFIRAIIIEDNPANKESFTKYASMLDKHVEAITEKADSAEMETYANELATYNDAFNKSATEALALFEAGNLEGALQKVNGDVQQANRNIQDISDKIGNYQKQQLDTVTKESKQAVSNSQIISVIAIIIGIALGVFLIFYIQRTISRPLKSVVQAANHIASGELFHENLTHYSKDEIGQLSTAFNEMKGNIKNLLTHIQNNAEHLTASVEELSASTEEITTSADEITMRINETANAAVAATVAANESAHAMDETAVGVQRIAEATQQLHHNAVTTFELATNGNNTVEEEVFDGLHSVTEGVKTIGHAGQAFESIVKAINTMTDQIEDISATSEEISASAEQVAASVAEIAHGASTSSDNTQIVATASKEQSITMQQINQVASDLSEKSLDLQNQINHFKL